MDYRIAPPSEIQRIGEIDRTETITAKYRCRLAADGLSIAVDEEILDPPKVYPNWDDKGVERRAARWKCEVEEGGALWFAENDGVVKGFAVLGPDKGNRSAEIVALFIDNDQRGKGIGTRLVELLEAEALNRRLTRTFVQSNDMVPSVKFYQSMGYTIAALMDPTIMLLPIFETNIILAKKL
jgi:GNAT superfamily N-acetyltransferase